MPVHAPVLLKGSQSGLIEYVVTKSLLVVPQMSYRKGPNSSYLVIPGSSYISWEKKIKEMPPDMKILHHTPKRISKNPQCFVKKFRSNQAFGHLGVSGNYHDGCPLDTCIKEMGGKEAKTGNGSRCFRFEIISMDELDAIYDCAACAFGDVNAVHIFEFLDLKWALELVKNASTKNKNKKNRKCCETEIVIEEIDITPSKRKSEKKRRTKRRVISYMSYR